MPTDTVPCDLDGSSASLGLGLADARVHVAFMRMPGSVKDYLAAHLARWPARAITLPWRNHDRGKPVTVKLMATTRERTVINRSYFNARAERSRKAIDAVFVADEAAADLTYIHQVGD